jgi:hypothetical protein
MQTLVHDAYVQSPRGTPLLHRLMADEAGRFFASLHPWRDMPLQPTRRSTVKKNEIRANAKNENGRKLQLNREAIRSLAGVDLKYVAGGNTSPCGISLAGHCI